MKIEIINWHKFNPRKDIAHSAWFRINHAFMFDPEWEDMDGQELAVWLYLLCCASLKNKSELIFDPEIIARKARVEKSKADSALEKLEKKACISITSRARYVDVTCALTTDGRNGRNVTDKTNETKRNDFPKKVKKIGDSESLRSRQDLKAFWLEVYRNRFKHEYAGASSAFFNSTLKKIHDGLGLEGAMEALKLYVSWDEPFITKKGHPIHLLMPNLHAMQAHRHREGDMYKSLARGKAREKVLIDSEQRLQEMKLYGEQQEYRLSENRIVSESSGYEISHNPSQRIPEPGDEIFHKYTSTNAETGRDDS